MTGQKCRKTQLLLLFYRCSNTLSSRIFPLYKTAWTILIKFCYKPNPFIKLTKLGIKQNNRGIISLNKFSGGKRRFLQKDCEDHLFYIRLLLNLFDRKYCSATATAPAPPVFFLTNIHVCFCVDDILLPKCFSQLLLLNQTTDFWMPNSSGDPPCRLLKSRRLKVDNVKQKWYSIRVKQKTVNLAMKMSVLWQ